MEIDNYLEYSQGEEIVDKLSELVKLMYYQNGILQEILETCNINIRISKENHDYSLGFNIGKLENELALLKTIKMEEENGKRKMDPGSDKK